MQKLIKNFISYFSSFFNHKDEEVNVNQPVKKGVFKEDNPLPNLDYMRMIELLTNHYRRCDFEQGHLDLNEMRRRLTQLTHHELKTLFDALVEIKIQFKEYQIKNDK